MIHSVAAVLVLAASAASAQAGPLVVVADGIRSSEGQVVVAVCRTSFDKADCPYGAKAKAAIGTLRFTFADVPAGRYAIAVFHDTNASGAMDTIPPGLPTEPYGFSNDIGRFGPPRFERALVQIGEGETMIHIQVRGLLS